MVKSRRTLATTPAEATLTETPVVDPPIVQQDPIPDWHKSTTIRQLSNIYSKNNSQHRQCSSKHRNHSNSKQISLQDRE